MASSFCGASLLLLVLFPWTDAFVPNNNVCFFHQQQQQQSTILQAQQQQQPKRQTATLEEDEAPAGIGGAEFFGGSKQKEEFFDPVAEEQASTIMMGSNDTEVLESTSYNRFDNTASFEDGLASTLAKSLQQQINSVLYERSSSTSTSELTTSDTTEYTYDDSNFKWTTSLSKAGTSNPLKELSNSLTFFKNVDVAIVGGKQTSETTFQLDWEISVVWPTFWSPRVLLLGTSDLRLNNNKIVEQTDKLLDNMDLLNTIGDQIKPRFWDWYHIGMTPSSEQMPKLNIQKPFFGNYQVYEIPSRLTLVPTMIEVGGRDDRNAQTIPNHAFSCIIKTMGPTRQRYVPTTPVEIQIVPGSDKQLKLKWSIPLAVEFQTNVELPVPGSDPEAIEGSQPDCSYEFQPRRKVATIPYGGNPQDLEVTEIRKQLYETIVKDGFKPKLDPDTGRPIFFFLDNTAKACYIGEEGLGMCVYEWRPKSVESNEVGIELEYA